MLQLKHCYMEEMEAEQEFIDDMGIGQFIDQQRAADSSHKANNQQRAAYSAQTTNTSQSQTMDESYIVGYRYI